MGQDNQTGDLFAEVALAPVSANRATANRVKANHKKANHKKADHKKADHQKADHKKADQKKTDRRTANPSIKQKPRAAVDHMAAAKRLHWKLRRAPSHSPEELKAGRLICRHLLAMLDEAELHRVPQNDSVYALSQADRS